MKPKSSKIAPDFRLQLKDRLLHFAAEGTCDDISDWFKVDSYGCLQIEVANEDNEDAQCRVVVSPKALAAFLFQSILLQPRNVAKALTEFREQLSVTIPRATARILSRDCSAPNAWQSDKFKSPDLAVCLAHQYYGGLFLRCGDFSIHKLRWRTSASGVEISERLCCEQYSTFEEWRHNYYGTDQFENEDDDYGLWMDELKEGVWPIRYVPFSMKLSFKALVLMTICRASGCFGQQGDWADSEAAQQWADICSLLTMILARLPRDTEERRFSDRDLLAEFIPLTLRSGIKGWPVSRRSKRGFRKSMTKAYKGLPLA